MNKWMKLAGVSFLIVSTLAVSGCGEEKKYNEAKAKLQPLMEETIDMPFKSSKDVKAMQEYMDKHAEKRAEVDQKLKELGELAKSDAKLNNDYQRFKKEFEEKDERVWYHNEESINFAKKDYSGNNNYSIGHPW